MIEGHESLLGLYRRAHYRPFIAMQDGGQIYRIIGTMQDGQFAGQRLGPASLELDILDPDVLSWKLIASYLD